LEGRGKAGFILKGKLRGAKIVPGTGEWAVKIAVRGFWEILALISTTRKRREAEKKYRTKSS